MTKLCGIDITRGYLGCYGAKVVGWVTDPDYNSNYGNEFGSEFLIKKSLMTIGFGEDKTIILDTVSPYSIANTWQGALTIPLVSNFCFMVREPTISRTWNSNINRQVTNVNIYFKIAPTISIYALMEYVGISSTKLSQSIGDFVDLNNIRNPFLLLVSTILPKRQRTPISYMKKGDIYYYWRLQTANIIEKDLFLTNYIIDYETGDVVLNLTNYVAPDVRGQEEPKLYGSLKSGTGSG